MEQPPASSTGEHRLSLDSQESVQLRLHPWNHAPRQLASGAFEEIRARHSRTLQVQHASIVDALSGRPLDVFGQLVPIQVVSTDEAPDETLSKVTNVGGLYEWLCERHAERCNENASHRLTCPSPYPKGGKMEVRHKSGSSTMVQLPEGVKAGESFAYTRSSCVLLTAPPAGGKTCLMSQLVMHARESAQLVPILVKVQQLQVRAMVTVG